MRFHPATADKSGFVTWADTGAKVSYKDLVESSGLSAGIWRRLLRPLSKRPKTKHGWRYQRRSETDSKFVDWLLAHDEETIRKMKAVIEREIEKHG